MLAALRHDEGECDDYRPITQVMIKTPLKSSGVLV